MCFVAVQNFKCSCYNICTHTHISYIYIYIYLSVYVHMCIHIYIYIYLYIVNNATSPDSNHSACLGGGPEDPHLQSIPKDMGVSAIWG